MAATGLKRFIPQSERKRNAQRLFCFWTQSCFLTDLMRFLASIQEVSIAILATEMNVTRNVIYTGWKKSIALEGELMEKNSDCLLFSFVLVRLPA